MEKGNGAMELHQTGQGFEVPVGLLSVQDGFNVRKDTTPDDKLVKSIKQIGVQNPIHIRNDTKHPGRFFIVDGERRFNAAMAAKLERVPVVPGGDVPDDEALVRSVTANEGQKPLTAAETADAIQRLAELQLEEKEIARVLGYKPRKINETLKALQSGDEEIIEALKSDDPATRIPPRAAARAASLPDEDRAEVVQKIKGKNAKQGVKEVQKVEAKKKITRRGRKPSTFPFISSAKKETEKLEIVLKGELKAPKLTKAARARVEAHQEIVAFLKGKASLTKLYPNALEALEAAAPKKKAAKKKVVKKAASKKTAGKKKVVRKTAAKKKNPSTTRVTAGKAGAKKKVVRKSAAKKKVVARRPAKKASATKKKVVRKR